MQMQMLVEDNPVVMNSSILLVVEESETFRRTIARAAERRSLTTFTFANLTGATSIINDLPIDNAIIDAGRGSADAFDFIRLLKSKNPLVRCLITTSFPSITGAVSSVKLGALDYVPKPVTADELIETLLGAATPPVVRNRPMNPDRLHWEYINSMLWRCDNNVTRAASKLRLHRRTLQRMLSKRPPRE